MLPLTVLMKQTRQTVRAIKQSIYLDVYENNAALCEYLPCIQKMFTAILSLPVPATAGLKPST